MSLKNGEYLYYVGVHVDSTNGSTDEDNRIPTFVKYSLFYCLECGCENIRYSNESCPYYDRFDKYNHVHESIKCRFSITIGAIFLTQIYRYLAKEANLLADPENCSISEMATIEKLPYANEIDKKLLKYLKDTIVKRMDEWEFSNKGLLLANDYLDSNFDDLSSFYIKQFNLCRDNTKKSTRIDQISVKKLFGFHSYTIFLKPENPISILHGTNGLGKTTIFRILRALLSKNDSGLFSLKYIRDELPFESFSAKFADNSKIVVTKPNNGVIKIDYYVNNESGNDNNNMQTFGDWYNNVSQQNKTDTLVINKEEKEEAETRIKQHYANINAFFPNLIGANRFLFVETNRDTVLLNLFEERTRQLSDIINKDKNGYKAIELLRNIDKELKAYETISFDSIAIKTGECVNRIKYHFELYQSFFDGNDLNPIYLDQKTIKLFSELENYKVVAKELENFIYTSDKRVMDISKDGLIYSCYTKQKESVLNVNNLIVDDIKVLYTLVEGIDDFCRLFESFYNEYDPSLKHINVVLGDNPKLEIVCSNGAVIDRDKLSSGELNILTILYEVCFNADNNSIVLIDEPEISLHLSWIERLTDAILEIAKKKGDIQIIMSSHSPYLSAGHIEFLAEGELLEDEQEII